MDKKLIALSEFALKCKAEMDSGEILQQAIHLLCTIFPFHGGQAIWLDRVASTKHIVTQHHRDGKHSSECKKCGQNEDPVLNWGESSQIQLISKPADLLNLACVAQQLRMLVADEELGNTFERNLFRTPALFLPLFGTEKGPLGFVHLFQEIRHTQPEDLELPKESDKPFLMALKTCIETLLENAMLHAAQKESNEYRSKMDETNQSLQQSLISLRKDRSKLLDVSHQAGMSDVATGVLHNIGNVLNSINVSATIISSTVAKLKTGSLQKALALLTLHKGTLDHFLDNDDLGKPLLGFIESMANDFIARQESIQKETAGLISHIEHVKSVINIQQSYAKVGGFLEQCLISDLVQDTLNLSIPRNLEDEIQVTHEFEAMPPAWINRHKVMQIIINLVSNARNSLMQCGRRRRNIDISVFRLGRDRVRIVVKDNGIGIRPEHLESIFAQGFSTRKDGHGVGLHTCANDVKELGGKLWCESQGLDAGATFILELPFVVEMDLVSESV